MRQLIAVHSKARTEGDMHPRCGFLLPLHLATAIVVCDGVRRHFPYKLAWAVGVERVSQP